MIKYCRKHKTGQPVDRFPPFFWPSKRPEGARRRRYGGKILSERYHSIRLQAAMEPMIACRAATALPGPSLVASRGDAKENFHPLLRQRMLFYSHC